LLQEETIEIVDRLTNICQLQKNASQLAHLGDIGLEERMVRFYFITYLHVGYWGY
jgi:hypothetical protein